MFLLILVLSNFVLHIPGSNTFYFTFSVLRGLFSSTYLKFVKDAIIIIKKNHVLYIQYTGLLLTL